MSRIATKSRNTRETSISVEVNLDGTGKYTVDTPVPFLSHMLELFSRHSLVDLNVKATGDTEVDAHHSVEDIGLVLGSALNEALGERRGIRRYGSFYVPMDEALCRVVIDLGGRPYLVKRMACKRERVGDLETSLFDDFFQAVVVQTRMNLHIDQMRGIEAHHAYEGVFKAFARAFRVASEPDPRDSRVPSSKGTMTE
jgi:imidazoleglycerol-phosphate dehydratase